MSEVSMAIEVLRKHMRDKSEGELYHTWMCNIKFAVYDAICNEMRKTGTCHDKQTLDCCEEGAKNFLDRLLTEQ